MPASGYSLYQEDNPFVEAMLRMMEIFGLIDRDRLALSSPYLPGYSPMGLSAFGGMPGLGGYPGLTGVPGLSPWSGLGGYPGMTGLPGLGGYPGMGQMPGAPGWPGGPSGNWINPQSYGLRGDATQSGYLDGIWELNNGSIVIIKRNAARLYVERDRHQDFTIGYDQLRFWWTPRGGNTTTTYRYQMRDGRMILRDTGNKLLLMRRRR